VTLVRATREGSKSSSVSGRLDGWTSGRPDFSPASWRWRASRAADCDSPLMRWAAGSSLLDFGDKLYV